MQFVILSNNFNNWVFSPPDPDVILSVRLSVHRSVCLSVCLSACPFLLLSFTKKSSKSLCPFIGFSVFLSIRLSACCFIVYKKNQNNPKCSSVCLSYGKFVNLMADYKKLANESNN